LSFRAVFAQVFSSTQIQLALVCNFGIDINNSAVWHQLKQINIFQ